MTEIIPQPTEKEVTAGARNAAIWVVGLLLARHAITFATTMVTSRLVSPADTGIAGMAAIFVAFMVLLDTGLTWATVQPKSLTHRQVNTMFWLGAAGGLIMLCASIAISPMLAAFFRVPELEEVGWVMGLTILFNSLTIQPSALLRRALLQKQNNLIDTISLVSSSTIAMGMAFLFRDYWALVLQAMLYPLLRFGLLLIMAKHRISAPIFDRSVIPILRQGLGFAASNYVTFIQLYLPMILIGKMYGDAALGYYTKANALKSLPTMYASLVVTDIMISSMAVFQSQPEKLGDFYRKALRVIAMVGCPAGAMLYPTAPELVRFLYGMNWGESVPLLKLLAIPAMTLPIATSVAWLFLANGSAKVQFKMNLCISAAVLCIYGASAALASRTELFVLTEVIVAGCLIPAVGILVSHRSAEISPWQTVRTVLPYISFSIFTAFFTWAVFSEIEVSENWHIILGLKLIFGVGVYAAACIAYKKAKEHSVNW